jgi:hypothetical protein
MALSENLPANWLNRGKDTSIVKTLWNAGFPGIWIQFRRAKIDDDDSSDDDDDDTGELQPAPPSGMPEKAHCRSGHFGLASRATARSASQRNPARSRRGIAAGRGDAGMGDAGRWPVRPKAVIRC